MLFDYTSELQAYKIWTKDCHQYENHLLSVVYSSSSSSETALGFLTFLDFDFEAGFALGAGRCDNSCQRERKRVKYLLLTLRFLELASSSGVSSASSSETSSMAPVKSSPDFSSSEVA